MQNYAKKNCNLDCSFVFLINHLFFIKHWLMSCVCIYRTMLMSTVCYTGLCWCLLCVLQGDADVSCVFYSTMLMSTVYFTGPCWCILCVLQDDADVSCVFYSTMFGDILKELETKHKKSRGTTVCEPSNQSRRYRCNHSSVLDVSDLCIPPTWDPLRSAAPPSPRQ